MGSIPCTMLQCKCQSFSLTTTQSILPQVFRSGSFYAVRGGGVGHMATRQCNEVLLADKHTLLQEEPPAQDGDSDEDPDEPAREGNEGEEEGDCSG
jgi:hypothetical protein